jgi:hypothetical protein
MANSVPQIAVPLRTRDGKTLAHIRIAAPPRNKGQPPIVELGESEARQWHEQPIQLLEGLSYDYELQLPFDGAQLRRGLVRPSGLSTPDIERGRIETGSHTGVLVLVLENSSSQQVAAAALEVRSVKVGYRVQYRQMLAELADRTMDLLIDLRAQSGTWVRPVPSADASSLVQRFFFIKNLVMSLEFRAAIGRIVANPHEVTRHEFVRQPISRGFKNTVMLGPQFSSGQPRLTVPKSHALNKRFNTIPQYITSAKPQPILDTSENRFVKFALVTFESVVSQIEDHLRNNAGIEYRQVLSECVEMRQELRIFRSNLLFREVGDHLQSLPLSSPVLQRRSGYREVLRAWILFNLAAELSWDGADDVFLAGKRDVASLYEYWVFFQLLDVVESKFALDPGSMMAILERGPGHPAVRLKSGRNLDLQGRWVHESKDLRVRFSYNRTFSRLPNPVGDQERSFPNAGSWTRSMRPDYTISIWPTALTELEAELAEHIVHLHFDAKYRVEALTELFGEDADDGSEETTAQTTTTGTAHRNDLLKMHAYRDGIRRSSSAFVIYPGSENRRWRAYTEILPSLGAIALAPGQPEGKALLAAFLEEAAEFVSTRTFNGDGFP